MGGKTHRSRFYNALFQKRGDPHHLAETKAFGTSDACHLPSEQLRAHLVGAIAQLEERPLL